MLKIQSYLMGLLIKSSLLAVFTGTVAALSFYQGFKTASNPQIKFLSNVPNQISEAIGGWSK